MPAPSYLRFARTNWRFAGFAFLVALASSFGQTYFVGIFGPAIQLEFALGHTEWATVYLLGTLASAVVLPYLGKRIDDIDLRRYVLLVCLIQILACSLMSIAAGLWTLAAAIFLLRVSGQGLMSHISVTSMTRYFDEERGRAVAVSTAGFAAGEALLPVAAVATIGAIGWRWTYGATALLVTLCLTPALLWLLRGHNLRHAAYLEQLSVSSRSPSAVTSWTRSQVLRDPRFYLLTPGVTAPPLILTALFFHHLNLAASKGWSTTWVTGNYVVFALASTATALVLGPLVDRFGGRRLVPAMLIPISAGLIAISLFDVPHVVVPYFIFIGIGVGIAHSAVSPMWAELYGVAHLGAIKSLMTAVMVFASACGPVLMGGLMDMGRPIEHVCLLLAGYALLATVGIVVALRRKTVSAPTIS